jgi:hypothetical protein
MSADATPSAPPGWYQAADGQWYPTQPLPAPPSPATSPAGDMSKPKTNMVSAVLATLFCFFPLGVVACIFASQVDSKWNAGDRAGAIAASKQARLFANLALGAMLLIVAGIIAIAALGSNASSKYSGSSAYINCMNRADTTAAQCSAYL